MCRRLRHKLFLLKKIFRQAVSLLRGGDSGPACGALQQSMQTSCRPLPARCPRPSQRSRPCPVRVSLPLWNFNTALTLTLSPRLAGDRGTSLCGGRARRQCGLDSEASSRRRQPPSATHVRHSLVPKGSRAPHQKPRPGQSHDTCRGHVTLT